MNLTGTTIVFDLDGTLVDTAPDLIGALNAVLDEERLPPLPLAAARNMVGQGARTLLQRGFTAAGSLWTDDRGDVLTARFVDLYLARIAKLSRPFPGAEAALDTLAAAGARLAVCTNKRTDLSLALLEAVGLSGRFAAVVGADWGGPTKPDPAHFRAAVAAAGGDLSRALMVGDSDNDVLAAHAAAAPAVVFSFGYCLTPLTELGADAVLNSWDQLPATAARLLATPCERPAAGL